MYRALLLHSDARGSRRGLRAVGGSKPKRRRRLASAVKREASAVAPDAAQHCRCGDSLLDRTSSGAGCRSSSPPLRASRAAPRAAMRRLAAAAARCPCSQHICEGRWRACGGKGARMGEPCH